MYTKTERTCIVPVEVQQGQHLWMNIRAISQEPLDLAKLTHIYREREEITEEGRREDTN